MSGSSDEAPETGGHGIDDDQLPEDLRPGEDNPLAEGLEDTETAADLEPGELLEEGKRTDQGSADGETDDEEDDEGD